MAHYIALIHKDRDSCYGVSFPDLLGVFAAGDTIDEAMQKAAEVIEFAAKTGPISRGKISRRRGRSISCARTRFSRRTLRTRWLLPSRCIATAEAAE